MKKQGRLICLFLCLSFCALYSQSVIHVPGEEATIQRALDAAGTGTTILVAPGTYFETLNWPNDVDGIKLIGVEGNENTILDGQGMHRVIRMSSSYANEYTEATLIEGLTIQNGFVFDEDGAGLAFSGGSPIFRDLVFKSNRAEGESIWGGGAAMNDFGGLMERCSFIGNEINSESRAYGAGLNLEVSESAELRGCIFDSNHGTTFNWAFGGGLYLRSSFFDQSEIKLNNCVFKNNTTTTESWSYGGGVYISTNNDLVVKIDSSSFENNSTKNVSSWSTGGALYSSSFDTEITNCSFISNSAEDGAGIYFDRNFGGFGKGFISNSVFTNNISFLGNSHGGAAIEVDSDPMILTLQNCIIDHNIGSTINYNSFQPEGGELNLNHCTFAYNSGPLRINNIAFKASNSIFWNNSDLEINEGWDPIDEVLLERCVVKNGFLHHDIITEDPDFLDEFLLVPSIDSPCLSAGIFTDSNTDFLGLPRPMPANSNPDIGAYEVGQDIAHVQVKFFHDENENGIKDESEYYAAFGSVVHNGETSYKNLRQEGKYIAIPQGLNSFTYDSNQYPNWELTNQAEYSFNVDSESFFEVIEYGMLPIVEITDVPALITSDRFRCGEEVAFTLSVKNKGTTIVDGIVWLSIDERLEDYSFLVEPNHIMNNRVGWDFEGLIPSSCLDFDFVVTAPLVNSADEVGELYCFTANVESVGALRPISFEYKAELRCSYDPNDKQVNPYRDDNLVLTGSDLLYTIRFQNTGNDYALNVVVTDTMDSNLDMNTFELINSSHAPNLEVTIDDRAVRFSFNRIYLPDSLSNEPASHGFINYTIKQKEDAALETNILNTAHIFFDFNPAIITNTTESILVDEFSTVSTSELIEVNIESYPNPASEYITLSRIVDRIRVYDLSGRVVLEGKRTNSIDVQDLEEGIYFVNYKVDDGFAKDTWIIAR